MDVAGSSASELHKGQNVRTKVPGIPLSSQRPTPPSKLPTTPKAASTSVLYKSAPAAPMIRAHTKFPLPQGPKTPQSPSKKNTVAVPRGSLRPLGPVVAIPKIPEHQRQNSLITPRNSLGHAVRACRDRELFPVKLTVNTKQVVLRCGKTQTVNQFTNTALFRLKRYLPPGEYVLRTMNGEPLQKFEILFESEYVQSCISHTQAPHLVLVDINNPTSVQKPEIRPTAPPRWSTSFLVRFLLPAGQALSLPVEPDATVSAIKELVCHTAQSQKNLLLLNHALYDIFTYGKLQLLSDKELVANVRYITKCRSKSTIPKLELVQKKFAPFTRQEEKISFEVKALVGVPISSLDEEEVYNFQSTMARLRYLESKNKRTLQIMDRSSKLRLSIHLADPTSIFQKDSKPQKLLITVHMPLLKLRKTVSVGANESADALLKRLWDRHYAKRYPKMQCSDFILKVVGVGEYLVGDNLVRSFEYVQKKLDKQEPIELVLFERANIPDHYIQEDDVLEEQWQQGGEEMLDASTIQYNHQDLCSETLAWDQKTKISIWEVTHQLRVKIIGVEQLSKYCGSIVKLQECSFMFVSVELYHGGERIAPMQTTLPVLFDHNPMWNSWAKFALEICNLPRATRLCLTLFGSNRSLRVANGMVDPEELPKCIPIAWVNCLLITHDHELRSGALSLRMWRDEKANPIGTCVQNSSSSAPILHVGFDEYQLPVVFPTKDETELLNDPGVSAILQPDPAQAELIHNLISKYPLYPLTKEERSMLWKFRRYCAGFPKSLPKLLLSVPYNSRACVQELHRLLQAWPMLPPIDAMELLDSRYADSKVRQYGVKCVAQFSDGELQSYLLQFVQVLKYEPYHDSALARFLMKRALRSRRIGHVFFWFLKAEVHVPEIAQRYGLMLEAYLHGCGSYLHELMKQNEILSSLQTIATKIKTVPLNVRRAVLLDELKHVQLPRKFQLPIDPSWEATSFVYEKCKFMDSKKLPLWLEMENADPHGKPLVFIFKCGDDLRQDMLTLQIIRFMDKMWKSEGLDLLMSPYGCISTGDEVGMIEVVQNSATTADITRKSGGATAVLKKYSIAQWLSEHNPGDLYDAAVHRFVRSCAGYCVATYVLGIGDRHNDNIMVQENGCLFHIDFGHFLGNFKKKFGIARERAKFVFTPDFAYVMGGADSLQFQQFVSLCCQAYNILRKHASKIIVLLAMMLSTGIPELRSPNDIDYVRNTLCLDLEEEDAAASFCRELSASLGCKTTIINNIIHILAH